MRESWGKGKRVVIIDDSIDFIQSTRLMIEKGGFIGEIHMFPSARSFFRIFEGHIDLLICDINMPVMDGFEVHDRLRGNGFKGCIILCSGDTNLLEKTFARNIDADILIKPLPVPETLEKIKKCLN